MSASGTAARSSRTRCSICTANTSRGTSALFRGVEGFGIQHHLRTDSTLALSEDLPAVAVAIDTPERVLALVDDASTIVGRGALTVERARRFVSNDLRDVITPVESLHEETKLTIYLSRQQRVDGSLAYVALCDLMSRRGVAGASALLGVDGTVQGRRERARFFARNADVPVMVIAVGKGERLAALLPEIAAMTPSPSSLSSECACASAAASCLAAQIRFRLWTRAATRNGRS